MGTEVDTDSIVTAAGRLQSRASATQATADHLGGVSGEAANADVAAGLTDFVLGWATALHLAAEDFGVLQTKVTAGAQLYAATDAEVAGAAGGSTPE